VATPTKLVATNKVESRAIAVFVVDVVGRVIFVVLLMALVVVVLTVTKKKTKGGTPQLLGSDVYIPASPFRYPLSIARSLCLCLA
jgi:hypothetical protein